MGATLARLRHAPFFETGEDPDMTQPPNRPWLCRCRPAPRRIDDPRNTLHEAVARSVRRVSDARACDVCGTTGAAQ